MTRYCTFCGKPLDEKRALGKSHYCNSDCRRSAVNEKRAHRAGEVCRSCGRRIPKPKVKAAENGCATVAQGAI